MKKHIKIRLVAVVFLIIGLIIRFMSIDVPASANYIQLVILSSALIIIGLIILSYSYRVSKRDNITNEEQTTE